MEVARDATEGGALEAAKGLPNVTKFTEGKSVKKVVYVPGKILNIIVA